MALGLSVKTSREFMSSIYGQKLNFVSLVFQRFPLLLLKRPLLLLTFLWSVCQKISTWNIFLRH